MVYDGRGRREGGKVTRTRKQRVGGAAGCSSKNLEGKRERERKKAEIKETKRKAEERCAKIPHKGGFSSGRVTTRGWNRMEVRGVCRKVKTTRKRETACWESMPAVLFAESTDSRGRYNANEKEKETGKKRVKKKRKGEGGKRSRDCERWFRLVRNSRGRREYCGGCRLDCVVLIENSLLKRVYVKLFSFVVSRCPKFKLWKQLKSNPMYVTLMQIHFVDMAAISRTVITAELFEYFDQIKIWSWAEINLAGE